ncbi:hypothetical protein [Marinobacter xestospongiae]|uniref:Uncharacterized protein n=1 Tax=Marinobacter xestospongiae TaxID=994319 RepID=A0ABU3W3E4_9GAMM|nr:hypothetical protein [Marinobacter xestospongiae]MDV2080687.1 hypothetical protein [Marinobacter xestospongiae]
MVDYLAVAMELGLATLLGVLAFRMTTLARTEGPAFGRAVALDNAGVMSMPSAPSYPTAPASQPPTRAARRLGVDRTDLLTQLHILLGLQDRVCREQGVDLGDAPEALQGYALAWLYGAAVALCAPQDRHSEAIAGLTVQLIHRKTGLAPVSAHQALATLTDSSVMLACFRHGLDGASHWRDHHFVPSDDALMTAITSYAFV